MFLVTVKVYERTISPDSVPCGFEQLLSMAVEEDPASQTCLKTARTWLDECRTKHETCSTKSSGLRPLPTRVLDIENVSAATSSNPRLVFTKGEVGEWAALSYCWGGKSSFILNTDTMDDLYDGKYCLEEYPRTLQDAVTITRSLGLKYLWIDALCIKQDSPTDWAAEAARMKDVYGGATITIAAAGSRSSTAGILKPRTIAPPTCELIWDIKIKGHPTQEKVFLRSSRTFWDTNLKGEPLNTRGWTLQESLLSPRTLSYGTQQMTWECQGAKMGENGRPILSSELHKDKKFIQSLTNNNISPWQRSRFHATRFSLLTMPATLTVVPQSWELHHDSMYSRWYEIISDFTGRNLTVGSDTLPALSGIASAFQNLLKDQYSAGLWKDDLVRGLLWNRAHPNKNQLPSTAMTMTGRQYRAPSWSWASTSGGRVHNSMAAEKSWQFITVQETARILHVKTTPRLGDPYGQISDAYLAINAPFCMVSDISLVLEAKADLTLSKELRNHSLEKRLRTEMMIDTSMGEFRQQHCPYAGQQFAVIRVMKHSRSSHSTIGTQKEMYMPGASFLILETTGVAHNEYRRIGCFRVSVPMDPDPGDENVALVEEIQRNKWTWKKIRIV